MASRYPDRVTLYEVGPRDGLQNEKSLVPTAAKVEYINLLSKSGLPAIEVTSFVSPRAIPQLADSSDVLSSIHMAAGVRYPVLVPNITGMQRALDAGAREVAVFTAASEGFTRANINMTIQESLDKFGPVLAMARQNGVRVRGYVSTAFGCPYDGVVSPSQVDSVVAALLDLGVAEVSIGDTIGVATPNQVSDVLALLVQRVGSDSLAVHFHDTRGTALANTLEALQMGISTIDASSAGLGGCPYAPGASGNLATEDLLYMLHGLGINTGVDLGKVSDASSYILGVLGRGPSSKYLQAELTGVKA
ncbi:MAG TPA: hydroxymethylglutaryl-CoA lyase [Chloroflexia bacterium]|nr:hydroxymethylglutaryl-CoA lyase [Chloroflexia bacterium]